MRVLGHRGSRRPGPENTAAAVRAALAAGADGVEVDVRRTAEGALVCCHDPQVGELAVVAGAFEQLGLDPLEAVLDAAHGRGRVVCEIKNVAGEPDFDAPDCATAALLAGALAARSGDDVVVSSFDWFSIEAVRAAGGPPTAFLTPPGVDLRAGTVYAAEAGHAELHAWVSDVLAAGPRGVARAHEAGLAVLAWTVADVAVARQAAAAGVDGLICDAPGEVVAGLGRAS